MENNIALQFVNISKSFGNKVANKNETQPTFTSEKKDDTIAPIITLDEFRPQIIVKGEEFKTKATAKDETDGDLTDSIISDGLDTSKEGTIQVLQAREGQTSPEGWNFEKGAIYTVDEEGKVLNTTLFDNFKFRIGLDMSREMNSDVAKQLNFSGLIKYLANEVVPQDERRSLFIELFDKIALPVTTIAFVLIGVPLAITPPRVRYNRGFLFSILIIFV